MKNCIKHNKLYFEFSDCRLCVPSLITEEEMDWLFEHSSVEVNIIYYINDERTARLVMDGYQFMFKISCVFPYVGYEKSTLKAHVLRGVNRWISGHTSNVSVETEYKPISGSVESKQNFKIAERIYKKLTTGL